MSKLGKTIAAWTVGVCLAGLAATWALGATATPEPPEPGVRTECAQEIAQLEETLQKAEQEGEDEILTFSRAGSEGCTGEELRDHLRNR